jgi:PKD repeat protein
MKKNVVVMTIIGMLLLSSFVITPAVGGDPEDLEIVITIEKPDPANESMDVPLMQSNVSVNISVISTISTGETVDPIGFYWEIGGDNITTNYSKEPDKPGRKEANISGPLLPNTEYFWYVYVNVTVDDEEISKNVTFSFTAFHEPPIANFTYTTYGLKVDFNGSLSDDPDGYITNYTWYFGDGEIGYEKLVQHVYDHAGDYGVSLTVTDNGSKTNTTTKTITVENATPIVDFDFSVDGKKVKFTSLSYDIDGIIASYYWEFGDGENSTEANPEHTYPEEWTTYTVTLNVTDNMGLYNETSKNVTTGDTTIDKPTIVKPERALYIRNQKIRPLLFRMALIIGDITIEVNASDEGSEIEKVEFYAGLLGTKYLGNDTTEPYSFNWTRDRIRFFHIQLLTVKAYNKAGNVAVERMIVRKLL